MPEFERSKLGGYRGTPRADRRWQTTRLARPGTIFARKQRLIFLFLQPGFTDVDFSERVLATSVVVGSEGCSNGRGPAVGALSPAIMSATESCNGVLLTTKKSPPRPFWLLVHRPESVPCWFMSPKMVSDDPAAVVTPILA